MTFFKDGYNDENGKFLLEIGGKPGMGGGGGGVDFIMWGMGNF